MTAQIRIYFTPDLWNSNAIPCYIDWFISHGTEYKGYSLFCNLSKTLFYAQEIFGLLFNLKTYEALELD